MKILVVALLALRVLRVRQHAPLLRRLSDADAYMHGMIDSARERLSRFWWHPTIPEMQAQMLRRVWAYTRSYDFSVCVDDGGAPYRFVLRGKLPRGLRMNERGTFFGTPR